MAQLRIAVYPGTFDPITNGHMDIIRRASRLVDSLIIGVAQNTDKAPLFNTAERVEMLCAELDGLAEPVRNVDVKPFDTLLLHFVRNVGASMIIRGLRAVSDFEYEFQMAGMNAKLDPVIETVFLMASDRHQFISSRFVKAIGELGRRHRPFRRPRGGASAERSVRRHQRSGPPPRRRLIGCRPGWTRAPSGSTSRDDVRRSR